MVGSSMNESDALDTILGLFKRIEATLLGLQQLRNYVDEGAGQDILMDMIEETETNLAEVKRRIIQ